MAPTCMIMTKGDDISLVEFRYASPNDLIGTILEQIRIIPKKGFHLGQKLDLILSPLMQRHLVGNKIVHYIRKLRCGIVSNLHQLLIRKGLRDGCGVLSELHGQSRQMIGHHILCSFLIPDFDVELLQQQNLSNQTGFSIFLGEKILQRRVIRKDNDFRS
jgi:hypothetical protein